MVLCSIGLGATKIVNLVDQLGRFGLALEVLLNTGECR